MASALDTTTTSRRSILGGIAVLGAAAALPASAATIDRSAWDRRVAAYRRCKALRDAEGQFGPSRRANDEYDHVVYGLKAKFGTLERVRQDASAGPVLRVAYETLSAAESYATERYGDPADQAAVDLALTPAPDLEAALFKIEVIKEFELDNLSTMPRDPFEVVAEDMARLGSAA